MATGLLLLLLARDLGPDAFGGFATAMGAVTLLSDLVDLGRNTKATREISQGHDPMVAQRLVADKLVVSVLVSAAAAAVLTWLTGQPSVYVPLALWLTALAVGAAAIVPLRAAGLASKVGVVTGLDRVIALSLWLLCSGLGAPGAAAAGWALLAGSAAASLLSIRLSRLRFVRPRLRDLRREYVEARHFGVAGLTSDLQLLDTPVLLAVAGSSAAGIFALPARVTGPLGILPTAMTALLLHRYAEADRGAIPMTTIRAGLRRLMTIMILISTFLFLLAPLLVRVVLGPAYGEAASVLQVYAVAMVFASFNQPAAQILQAAGRERLVSVVVAAGSIISLLGVGVGGALAGALGASLGFAAMQVLIFASFVRPTQSATTG